MPLEPSPTRCRPCSRVHCGLISCAPPACGIASRPARTGQTSPLNANGLENSTRGNVRLLHATKGQLNDTMAASVIVVFGAAGPSRLKRDSPLRVRSERLARG